LIVRNHKSLEAWREAREISRVALQLARFQWKPHSSVLLSQLQRAALSTQLNIAEGYALYGRRRTLNHLTIAYGSAVESTELLEFGLEEQLLPADSVGDAIQRSKRCHALLLGLMRRYRG
jgi:four helix bundle protein